MKLAKRVAQEFRTSRTLAVEKVENHVWVSDTYIAVKFNFQEFKDFKEKYNSYKTTIDIPKFSKLLKIKGDKVKKLDEELMEAVIPEDNQLDYELKVTKEVQAPVGAEGIRKLKNNELGDVYIAREYEFLLENAMDGYELYTAGNLSPVALVENSRISCLIMPVRNEG